MPQCLLFILLCLVNVSHQCGVTTHNVIANTALDWFDELSYKKLIHDNLEAFQAGAAFPDWGYNCIMGKYIPNLHEGSELAHWLPFQKELIRYIRDTNDNPELVALLFGIVSHSVSDILWHDLDHIRQSRQGFITALGNSNCEPDCKYSPHTISDVGGEFVAAFQTNLTFLKSEWKLPTKDIINVYKRMGYTFEFNETVLDICVAELYTEVQAISKLASELLLAYYDKVAPFLFEEYQDWWLGGVDSNALWTLYCWNSTINWLEHGIPSGNPPYCYPLTGKVLGTQGVPPTKKRSFLEAMHTKNEIQSRQTLKSILNTYNHTRSPARTNEKFEDIRRLRGRNPALVPKDLKGNSRFGHSIVVCDLTGDGHQDIIIGAPNANVQRGAVYIYYNGTESPIQVKHNSTSGTRFGYSLQCLDLDKDGRNDLIVGAPGFKNYPNMEYTGMIHIFYNRNNKRFVGKQYFNYGNVLDKGDLNGDGYDDLIIGVPYAKTSKFESGEIWYILAGHQQQPHKLYSSPDFWSWFGYKSHVINYRNQTFLLTSAPNYNNGTNAVGKLVCFNSVGKIVWEIIGDAINGKFGMSFDTYNDTLAVSSPTTTVDLINQGVVYVLPLNLLFTEKRVFKISELVQHTREAFFARTPSYTYKGGTYYSRLGWDVKYWGKALILTEPYYDGRGKVHFISNSTVAFVGEQHSQFGYTTAVSGNILLVGAPRDGGKGAVSIYYI